MKIDLNFTFKDLTGVTLTDPTDITKPLLANRVMAANLSVNKFKNIDAMKAWEIAQKLYAGQVIDLTTDDQLAFQKVIKEELRLPSQLEAPILYAFLSEKEKKSTPNPSAASIVKEEVVAPASEAPATPRKAAPAKRAVATKAAPAKRSGK
jgi:hypothetical protein